MKTMFNSMSSWHSFTWCWRFLYLNKVYIGRRVIRTVKAIRGQVYDVESVSVSTGFSIPKIVNFITEVPLLNDINGVKNSKALIIADKSMKIVCLLWIILKFFCKSNKKFGCIKKNRIFASSSEQKANPFLFRLVRTSRSSKLSEEIIENQSKKIDFLCTIFLN